MSVARRLPPLNALRAFEAAARRGSFVQAAEELHVTAGAISQQVKALEAWLGRPLFRRLHRGVALNEAGTAYLETVGGLLDDLAAASQVIAQRTQVLRITALPAFAERWLMPRLGRFQALHPQVEIALSADDRPVDLARDPVDLWLCYGAGEHPGCQVERLFGETLFPVCAPALLDRGPALERPGDLTRHTLLRDAHWRDDWRLWLAAAGVRDLDPTRGPSFTLFAMVIQAALDGLGVALAHEALVADDLAAGRLVAPFELRLPAAQAYYLVSSPKAAKRPDVMAFRAWLRHEATEHLGPRTGVSVEN
jgi:LysR family glycine cleavage system transcriptional activator